MLYTRARSFLVLLWLFVLPHYGTALQAAEQAKKPEVVALLRNVRQD